jgi:microcompartment protein CcmK/EutM
MMLGRVVGNVVATVKHDALAGRTLLLIQPITKDGQDRGRPFVAVDAVGAGYRETVYWCRGKEASLAFDGAEVPTDASIVGIVDQITLHPDSSVETQLAASPSPTNKDHRKGRR